MRILYLTGQIKYLGGIERVISLKVNYLSDILGEDVFLLTYEQNNAPFYYHISNKVKWDDLQINYDVALNKKSFLSWRNIKKAIKHFILLYDRIKKIKPDIIIIPNGGYDYLYLPFIHRSIPKVREFHSSFSIQNKMNMDIKERFKKFINTFVLTKYSCVVVLNENEKVYIPSPNVVVIPNPIIINRTNWKVKLNSSNFLAAGRLSPVKGFDTLIVVWSRIKQKNPLLKLHIYGDGDPEYINYLNNLIKEYRMSDNIILHRGLSDLVLYMENYSALICTSHSECFPMIILESMSIGLPVISYDCPFGPRNIITNNVDGFLVKNQNREGLLNKIIDYSNMQIEEKAKISLNAISKAKKFKIEKVMMIWMELFKQLIEGKDGI